MTTQRARVLFYGGEFGYGFSNFSAFQVEWEGRVWMTSEHAYQAAKFTDMMAIKEIHAATSAHVALKTAQKYQSRIRASWNDAEKLRVMEDILRHKLAQHPYIMKQLLQSGDAELIEDAPKDPFWGRGEDWQGQNNLGKLWMMLRGELQAQP